MAVELIEMIMLQELESGTRIRLKSGATAEVTDNPKDGSWVYVRYVSSPNPAEVGKEELVFAEDVVALTDPGKDVEG